jgi:hypothetical protein
MWPYELLVLPLNCLDLCKRICPVASTFNYALLLTEGVIRLVNSCVVFLVFLLIDIRNVDIIILILGAKIVQSV